MGEVMDQGINYEKAINMLNTQLQQMKMELDEVDKMSLRGEDKKLAKRLHKTYDEIEKGVKKYSKSQDHKDFNWICRTLETLQPAFTLNYNEICYQNKRAS